MKRWMIPIVIVATLGATLWVLISELGKAPSGRDDPPAIILRAPDGFEIQDGGTLNVEAAAQRLLDSPQELCGVRFDDSGDQVIVFVDRRKQFVTEMRAARTGTIVERTWRGEVDQRLAFAVAQGNFDVPGLPMPSGKNLYH